VVAGVLRPSLTACRRPAATTFLAYEIGLERELPESAGAAARFARTLAPVANFIHTLGDSRDK
jgi:hypothetical protein